MNKSNYTLSYAVFPDTKAFMENLERGSKMRETHSAFLSDHLNYFPGVGDGKKRSGKRLNQ